MTRPPLTPGRILYLAYHRPRAWLKRCVREGGPVNQWTTRRARKEMEAAAAGLKPMALPRRGGGDEPVIVGMTGASLWYQSAFCLHSFYRRTGVRLPLRLIDDGTLTRAQAARLSGIFPGAIIQSLPEARAAADRRVPPQKHPRLRSHENNLVLISKLTLVAGGGEGWQLFLDADMLFHNEPAVLKGWLGAPSRPVFMTDIQNAYGYPPGILDSLAGRPVPRLLNTGVSGLHADMPDWGLLEAWIKHLLDLHGSSYFLEQALFALLMAGRDFLHLPAKDYIVAPDEAEIRAPRAALHHYVDLTKSGYFRHAWRHALHQAETQAAPMEARPA